MAHDAPSLPLKLIALPRKPTIIIVHGVDGFPEKNWYGWLAETLRAEGYKVIVPQLPTELPVEGVALHYKNKPVPETLRNYDHQTLKDWSDAFEKATGKLDAEQTVLIGHSLGGLFVLRKAEENTGKPFRAVLAVSPVGGPIDLPECYPGLATFYEGLKPEAVRRGAQHISVLAGTNDEVVPFKQTRALTEAVGADQRLDIGNGGHLNTDSGYKSFPLLLQQTRDVLRLTAPSETSRLAVPNVSVHRPAFSGRLPQPFEARVT